MLPTIGRIVHYTLNEHDANAINKCRADFAAWSQTLPAKPEPGLAGADGRQVHYGNSASAGQTYPAMVVAAWGNQSANLQVQLDGNDTYWATSRSEGEAGEHGKWIWPPRV